MAQSVSRVAPTAVAAALIAGLAAMTLLVVGARPAMACSCPPPPPPQQARDEAAAVFAGQVASIEEVRPELRVLMQVSEVWAGEVHERHLLMTHSHSSMCGVPFALGQEYLVYAGEREGILSASLCSRTAGLADASGDLAAFGRGSDPLPGADPPEAVGPGAAAWLLALAAALGAAATVWLLTRRRAQTSG